MKKAIFGFLCLVVVLLATVMVKDAIAQANVRSSRMLANNIVVKSKLAYTAVTVTVNAASPTGASAANAALAGGEILGIVPAGNQDQLVDNVVLNADGSVTVTLAAAATANNTFRVVVLRQRS